MIKSEKVLVTQFRTLLHTKVESAWILFITLMLVMRVFVVSSFTVKK